MDRAELQVRQTRPARLGLLLSALGLGVVSSVGTVAIFAAPGWLEWMPALAETAEHIRGGRLERIRDLALLCGLVTSGINALVLLTLWGTSRFWLDDDPVPERPALAPPLRRPGRAFSLLVASAMLVGGLLAWPRLDQSFWDDEVQSLRMAIHGRLEVDDSGHASFRAVNLGAALWAYETPANHVPYSLMARGSLALWRAGSGAREDQADEVAMRIPAWLLGIASIGATAFCLWRLGFPNAGVCAAWILALHPWHMRYASEARGYTLVTLLVSVLLASLVSALHRGSWKRWALFGTAQFLLLWTYPAAVFCVAVMNVVALVAIARDRDAGPAAPSIARLVVVGAFGAMLWIQLMAPNVFQIVSFIDHDPFPGVEPGYLKRLAAHLLVGLPWRDGHFDPHFADLRALMEASPLVAWGAFAFAAMLGVLGAGRLLRAGRERALLVWAVVLPGPLFFWFSWARENYLFERYLLFVLPGWVMLLSLGLDTLVARAVPARRRATLGPATVMLFLLGFAALGHSARSSLWERSFQPIRESVAATRGLLDVDDPANDAFLTASFHQAPRHYDPRLRRIEAVEELRALMSQADREDRALFLNIGRLDNARRLKPEMTALVLQDDLFERVVTLYGFDHRRTRDVFRYRGAPASP